MSLTNREAFKFGFLLRCADENLSPEETQERIKAAADHFRWDGRPRVDASLVEQVLQAWEKRSSDTISDLLGLLGSTAVGGLGLAAGVGGLGGYGLAKAMRPQVDADEIKQQELVAAYKQQTDRIRRLMAARSYRQNQPPRRARLHA